MSETQSLDDGASQAIPRLRMSEMGTIGLKVSHNQILEEFRKDLAWPVCVNIYKQMSYDSTIAASLSLFEMMLERVEWRIEAPIGANELQNKRAEFINQCIDDMDHSWRSFIKEVCSFLVYGFSPHEKVFRKRYYSNGSKFNDGYVGWKKLPIRSQDTIVGWQFSDDGRDFVGIVQDLALVNNSYRLFKIAEAGNTRITIPAEKLLNFKYNAKRNNPQGNSPLKQVYVAWKFRTSIEEIEAIGISRDMGGMPVLRIPPVYMSEDATPEQKAIYEYYKSVIRNIQNNEQSGLIIPNAYDPESRMPLFDFELMGVTGGKQYDTDKIIRRWDNKILTTLFTDFLKLGQDQVGSFALAGEKTNLMIMAVEAIISEICDVINSDLIPQTFQLNGWSETEYPKLVACELDDVDIDAFSSAVQRIFSVNAVEMDRDVYNDIRKKVFQLQPKPEDEEVVQERLPNNRSRAGDGMKTAGDGTSTSPGGGDKSVSNKSNK
jgi:hypothetical protein